MPVKLEIHEDSCRGCQMCVEVCPVEVYKFDEASKKCKVQEAADCIGCLSCAYVCPALAIRLSDYHAVKNFYRDTNFSRRAERFL
jgi:NAD-dependent dihydropyrimidine dehydrogenase PreA subunit